MCRGRPDSSEDVFFQFPILNQGLDLTLELVTFRRQMPMILVVFAELVSIPLGGILRERTSQFVTVQSQDPLRWSVQGGERRELSEAIDV